MISLFPIKFDTSFREKEESGKVTYLISSGEEEDFSEDDYSDEDEESTSVYAFYTDALGNLAPINDIITFYF